jgi:cytoskeletal protein CcmA (bactofilin family)
MPSSDSQKSPSTPSFPAAKSASLERSTIGRSLVIKGAVSGAESLYIDGRIEGVVNLAGQSITISTHGNVAASISAREVVIMGTVQGNVECTDRLELRSQGSLTGDVVTQRISIEEGAVLKGGVQIRAAERKVEAPQPAQASQASTETAAVETTEAIAEPAPLEPLNVAVAEQPRAAAAGAGAEGSPRASSAPRPSSGPTFADRASALIKKGYKPKVAVELLLQDAALESRNDPRIMSQEQSDAEDFLQKIRKGLI